MSATGSAVQLPASSPVPDSSSDCTKRRRSARVPALIQGGPASGYPSGSARLNKPIAPIRLIGELNEYPSIPTVDVPLAFTERNALRELATNSNGVLTFCPAAVLPRKRSELKIVCSTG